MKTRTTVVAAAATLAALGGAFGIATATSAQEEPPPIAVEEFTRVDGDTLARGEFIDAVGATLNVTYEGRDELSIDLADLSHVAVARITVQPGAQFPWHTHPGPVIVNVVQGELVYVWADDCIERPYPSGTAFVDPGRGNVHTAYNPTDEETVILAIFTEVTADGPFTITEGVEAPDDNCGLPTSPPG